MLKQQIIEYLDKYPNSTVSEISNGTKIILAKVKEITTQLYDSGELNVTENKEFSLKKVSEQTEVEVTTYKKPRKPYSINPMNGYKTSGDKVTIFLNRMCHAKSVTLSSSQLQTLLAGLQQ